MEMKPGRIGTRDRCRHCTDARPSDENLGLPAQAPQEAAASTLRPKSNGPSDTRLAGRMPTVPVTVRLTRAQLETAQYLANKLRIRLETLLKKLIDDGLCGQQRAARLKNWS
jgi:hypothetical protein